MKKLPAAVAVVVLPLILVTGCSSSGGSVSSNGAADRSSGFVSSPELPKAAAGESEVSGDLTQEAQDKAVITTGYSTILVKDLSSATEKLSALVTANQGRIESRSENPSTDYNEGSSNFTLRVPSTKVDSFIEELKTIGEAQEINLSESDVTLQYKDLQSRIGALEAGVERLTQLLAQADTTDALITIENAITDRQVELDSLKTQELYLNDQISESTLTVTLITESEAAKKTPEDYSSAVGQGWEALVAFATGLVIFLGILTPWLIPLGVIAGIFFLVRHQLKRKKKVSSAEADSASVVTQESKEASGP